MVALFPERAAGNRGRARGGLLGGLLGFLALVGGGSVVGAVGMTLTATAGVGMVYAVALAAGVWAGTPDPHDPEPDPHLVSRWIGAGVAVGLAGVFALFWQVMGVLLGSIGAVLGLLFLVGFPVYGVGLALAGLITHLAEVARKRVYPQGIEDPATQPDPPHALVTAILAGTALGVLAAGVLLAARVAPGPLLFGAAALFTSPLLLAEGDAAIREVPVWEGETPFSTLRVVDIMFPGARQPERRLLQNEEIESGELVRSGAPTFAYIAALERWLLDITPAGSSYLFLGGGAYTLPRRVAEDDPRARITVAELDPQVTRVAERFFGLRAEHGIRTEHGDARAVLEAAPAATFDRVVIDVYDGQEAIPFSLLTREAWEAAARALRPGGIVALNLIGVARGAGQLRFWSTVRTAADALAAVAVYMHLGPDFPDPQNFVLAASPDVGVAFPPRAGSWERWERERWPELPGTVVFRDRYAAGPRRGESLSPPARAEGIREPEGGY